MNEHIERLESFVKALTERLEGTSHARREIFGRARGALRSLQEETRDVRLRHVIRDLDAFDARLEDLVATPDTSPLVSAAGTLQGLNALVDDAAIGATVRRLLDGAEWTLPRVCECLLTSLVDATAAERGFVLFCAPDSTEARVVAPRGFDSARLVRGEERHSRTLVARAVREGRSLLFSHAAQHAELIDVRTVQDLNLKSVLVVPLRHGARIVGAVYLENRGLVAAFDEATRRLVESVTQFASSFLRRLQLMPVPMRSGTSVFLDADRAPRGIIGEDSRIHDLRLKIDRVAGKSAPVLITGESGTGKELVARALHDRSPRRDKPFVALNCAAIPESLFEAELFGREKGAFTGATERLPGLVQQAEGGTLFLDEIHELAHSQQPKLLRLLQDGEYRAVGGRGAAKADIHVIAATSRNLQKMIKEGRFLDALYYRLNVVTLWVPPLRHRLGDLRLLVDHFLRGFSAEDGKAWKVDDEVYEHLARYPFPGNVRELQNLLWGLVILTKGDTIRVHDLPREIVETESDQVSESFQPEPETLEELRERQAAMDRYVTAQRLNIVKRAVEESGGNVARAARRLGIHRVNLHKILKGTSENVRHGVVVPKP